ncbi:ABC transporter substrate-binding protein [Desulfovibrio subterraneus]|uniref:Branched-chain amino acid ABC transporter substrate-binding protein n=1 Tax=Desulfovibrio subterraneus TaxID=2718620 RepID=A0A7J0BGK0_9BACT|nr:ABC transporter substrate-binding protein [Desulfovibrio subterraneus]WBF67125.1 ABC transporter substrate-binding protein [Desulfovibrio subterraneus]GFM32867.1 branched-chain amino acid ABC transporter substrate-binding protein [Desulfovibrio subterraneus]
MRKIVFTALLVLLFAAQAFAADAIKIGFNIPLTGDIPKVGEASKFAAEMLKEDINGAGGLEVGGKKYMLDFIYEDNESKAESAVNVALKLIERDQVVAIVGPNSSKQAVPAGGTCDDNQTPMVTPWSTNPDTTLDRPWVFRAAFLDPFQGPVVANFAEKTFGAKTAAVIYDVSNDYSKGLAEIFQQVWEGKKGAGSVVAFESHGTKDQDFSAQLSTIVAAKPDFIFIPDNYNQVALIVKQARQLGYKGPFMGSDAWGSAELMTLCGDDCVGQYFSTHYAAAGATGKTKEFIDRYSAKYGYTPDDVAALTWDATRLVLQAIQEAGTVDSDVRKERKAIREAMSKIQKFEGITGTMSFDEQGDPIKCAVVVKISPKGEFEFTESVCPE